MKKSVFAILIAAAISTFADQPINTLTTPSKATLSSQEQFAPKQGFFYVRFAASGNDLIHSSSFLPGLGIGYRRLSGNGAGDISIDGIGHGGRGHTRIFWTAPKMSYIRYLQPDAAKSAYIGGGLAWGGMSSTDQSFIGIIPSVVTGYEFVHKGTFLGFAELTASQPTLSVYRKGHSLGPCLEFSTGLGF